MSKRDTAEMYGTAGGEWASQPVQKYVASSKQQNMDDKGREFVQLMRIDSLINQLSQEHAKNAEMTKRIMALEKRLTRFEDMCFHCSRCNWIGPVLREGDVHCAFK